MSKPTRSPRTITSCRRYPAGSTKPSTTGTKQAMVATHRPGPDSVMRETNRESCARDGEIATAAAAVFERDQRRDDQQHQAGHLRRAGEAPAVEPGGEDRERE